MYIIVTYIRFTYIHIYKLFARYFFFSLFLLVMNAEFLFMLLCIRKWVLNSTRIVNHFAFGSTFQGDMFGFVNDFDFVVFNPFQVQAKFNQKKNDIYQNKNEKSKWNNPLIWNEMFIMVSIFKIFLQIYLNFYTYPFINIEQLLVAFITAALYNVYFVLVFSSFFLHKIYTWQWFIKKRLSVYNIINNNLHMLIYFYAWHRRK